MKVPKILCNAWILFITLWCTYNLQLLRGGWSTTSNIWTKILVQIQPSIECLYKICLLRKNRRRKLIQKKIYWEEPLHSRRRNQKFGTRTSHPEILLCIIQRLHLIVLNLFRRLRAGESNSLAAFYFQFSGTQSAKLNSIVTVALM